MRSVGLAMMLTLGVVAFGNGHASALDDDAFAKSVNGSYLLSQDDGFQRVVTLSESGTVAQVSEQEPLYGYSSGLGAWTRTGDKEVRIRIIDFEYDLDKGTTTGVARLDMTFTFTENASDSYHALSGAFTVEAFGTGENPQAPGTEPNRTQRGSFRGERIVVPPKP